MAVNVAVLIPLLMPVALSLLYAQFGDSAVIGAFIVWPIVTLSIVAFVVAVSQVDAEREGREPGTLFLSVLYHLGGFVGVYFAKRLFPESKTCAEMLKTLPKGTLFLGCAIAACVFVKLL